MSNRVLTHFDDQLPLILECDASPYGLGAVLSHQMPDGSERPVCFASRTLTKAEQNYSHLDKEALAIIFGVKKYHQYLFGRQFGIKTDHKPLTHIFHESKAVPSMASGRIQRWALMLGAYDYRIQYRQGKANANADALSRLPLPSADYQTPQPAELIHLMEHLETTPLSGAQIKTWTDRDPILARVRRWVLEGWPEKPNTESTDEFLPYTSRRLELGGGEGEKSSVTDVARSPSRHCSDEVTSKELYLVAGGRSRHRDVCEEVHHLPIRAERSGSRSIASLVTAKQAVDPCPH